MPGLPPLALRSNPRSRLARLPALSSTIAGISLFVFAGSSVDQDVRHHGALTSTGKTTHECHHARDVGRGVTSSCDRAAGRDGLRLSPGGRRGRDADLRPARAKGSSHCRQLQALARAGERAILLYQPGLDFIEAILACFFARLVAVPVVPLRNSRELPRLLRILQDSGASLVLSNSVTRVAAARTLGNAPLPGGPDLAVHGHRADVARRCLSRQSLPELSSLAFLQYTSGSTGSPKGVMVTHANLSPQPEGHQRRGSARPLDRLRGLAALLPRHGPHRERLPAAVPGHPVRAHVAHELPRARRRPGCGRSPGSAPRRAAGQASPTSSARIA